MQVYKNDAMWSQYYEVPDEMQRGRTLPVFPRSSRSAISGTGDDNQRRQALTLRPIPKRTVRQAGAYFETLSKAAHHSNKRLQELNRPFRFAVSHPGEKVFLDIEQLSQRGTVISQTRRDITHDDFVRWIDDISEIKGLIIDEVA
ncbi:MAG: hypothetical protein ACLFSB_11295 [Chitinispirillaceae bacterium]